MHSFLKKLKIAKLNIQLQEARKELSLPQKSRIIKLIGDINEIENKTNKNQ